MVAKFLLRSVCAALILSIGIPGFVKEAAAKTFNDSMPFAPAATSAVGDVSTPLHAALSIDPPPLIGQPATVTCRVTSDQDAPDTKAQIELPANARLVSGDLSWKGNLAAGQSITFSAMIVFDAGGNSVIYCRALRAIDAKNSWGDLAALYLSVGPAETHQGYATVPPPSQIHTGDSQQVDINRLLDRIYRILAAVYEFFGIKNR